VLVGRRLEIRGVRRGVGFRPFVRRLATRFGLTGLVRDAGGVVEIVAEGPASAIDAFSRALEREVPLSRLDVVIDTTSATGAASFEVVPNVEREAGDALVSPDVAPCPACLAELFDPGDRRYRYPFIDCPNCGPRSSITEAPPFVRERTSMRDFPRCPACDAEYRDPTDRRFHAETIACATCGPTLRLIDATGAVLEADPIEDATRILLGGGIVAVKGLGGYHVACDARSEDAVSELRRRGDRPDEPFAVMVADVADARERFELGVDDEIVLTSPQAPVVLVPDRGTLAPAVAPGHRRRGVMLPSTPTHHLLLREVAIPLVMAGGPHADPIGVDDADTFERLAHVVDAFLVHDRAIVARAEDSVAVAWRGGPVLLRRARGFAPAPIELARPLAPILGTGADRDGAFCLASGRRAHLSHPVGEVDTERAIDAFGEAVDRDRSLVAIDPERVAHDLDPDLRTSRFARSLGLPAIAVQHHRAHVAAVMAEHSLREAVIGVAFDGNALGDDGGAWGGEVFTGEAGALRRGASLRSVAQPADGVADREPWLTAVAFARDAGVLEDARALLDGLDVDAAVERVGDGRVTTSAGRLFDAVAALIGVCRHATDAGQPAALLEQVVLGGATREYGFDITPEDGLLSLDTRPIVAAIVKDLRRGRPRDEVAGRFHRTMAAATLELVRALRGVTGLTRVVLSGGVFENEILASDLVARLETVGFMVHRPRLVPSGEGGLALGQVWVASALEGGDRDVPRAAG
jgi:hydrogenase maturation protein HypF